MAVKPKDYVNQICEKAVVFARVSSQEQEKGASIDAQLESVYNYCKNKELKIIKEYILTESSTQGDRKQYKEMLDYVSKYPDKIAIVVNCVDRLQRSYKDTPALDELRKSGKLEIHFLKENMVLHKDSGSMEILFWNINVLMANSYVLCLTDNVKRSLNFNWSKGKWQGFAPVGYINCRNSEGKSDIVIDPDRAPLVKKLFDAYSLGTHTLQSLENMAKEMGLNTRQSKNGKTICRMHIQNILSNPFYYGVMRVKGKLIPHIYPPIISKVQFDLVQDIMHDKSRPEFKLGRGEIPFVFRGLITCATCGGTITSESHTSRSGRKHTYLKCNHRKGPCNQCIVREDDLLKQLEDSIFNRITLTDTMYSAIKQGVQERLTQEYSSVNATIKNTKARITELNKKADRLFDFYLEGKCNQATYDKQKSQIDTEIAELQARLSVLNRDTGKDIDIMMALFDVTANAKRIMVGSIIPEKRALLNLILSNAKLDGTSLCFDLKKPFDKLLFAKGCKSWLGQLDSNQRHTD